MDGVSVLGFSFSFPLKTKENEREGKKISTSKNVVHVYFFKV